MIQWIKSHPYLSGLLALFLIVLFFVIRSRSGGSSSTRAASPGGPSEALQAANLQAGVQQQGIQAAADAQSQQTAAALAAHLADTQAQSDATAAARDVALQNILTAGQTAQYAQATQLAAVNSTNAAQVNIEDTRAQAGVQIAGIGASRDITIAGIQGDVAKTNIAAQLAGLEDTNATSLALGQLQLSGLLDTNASAVQINAQNNQTQQLGITTQGDTQQLAIRTAGDVSMFGIATNFGLQTQHESDQFALQTQNQTGYWRSIMADDRWGSGENQVSALAALVGQPSIGVAAQQGQAQSNQAESGMWGNLFSGIFGAVGAAAGPGGAITRAVTPVGAMVQGH